MLDPKGRRDIEAALRELHAGGMTIIQVTHQLEAENFDDIQRIIVLSHGCVKWQGTTREFWDEAEGLGFELPDVFKFRKYCDAHGLAFPNDFAGITPAHREAVKTHLADLAKFTVKGLNFRHDDKSYALRNVNADVFAGEWLSIIGRTGSGKSTLVQHFNALYKIQEGQILFDGSPLAQTGKEVRELRQRVGLVFQHPEDQLFSATVREELAFAPKNAGFRNQELDDARKIFLEKYSTFLENYLVNELFMNCYPYQFLNENITRNCAVFMISYKIFELILFAATHKGFSSKEDLLSMVDWFTVKMDHAKALHDKFFELLKGIDDIFLLMTCLLKG